MLQNPRKTLGFKKNKVYKIPPGGEVNHIQPVAYTVSCCVVVLVLLCNICNRILCKQTLKTLFKRRILGSLNWVCTVFLCPKKRTLCIF